MQVYFIFKIKAIHYKWLKYKGLELQQTIMIQHFSKKYILSLESSLYWHVLRCFKIENWLYVILHIM